MTITAKIIADSISDTAPRLTSMQLRYPRFIHAEMLTHRVFSRSASSSRAIPIERMIQDVLEDPAMPVSWGSNQSGMQAGADCEASVFIGGCELSNKDAWLSAMHRAVEAARAFSEAGYHKQIANRLLEPFGHISVIVTATDWDNFYALRRHEAADPTMRALADAMWGAMEASTPERIAAGDWHIPYITEEDRAQIRDFEQLCDISAARCARVSYLNHDQTAPDIDRDLALAKTLRELGHMSPFEHQAGAPFWREGERRSNLRCWNQRRKMLE